VVRVVIFGGALEASCPDLKHSRLVASFFLFSTTSCSTIPSNKDHAVYSDWFSPQRKCTPEDYHAVCLQYVALSSCPSAKQMGKSKLCARCLQKKGRRLTTPRSSKPPFPDSADVIVAEIEVSQRCALRQHSCQALCPCWSDVIAVEIEVSQRCALRQHSCEPACPSIADPIDAEIDVSER
jgi:hypothetical protein